MSRSKSKIPSPARSHGALCSPMRKRLRSTRSVCSTTSNTSVRLTEIISDSFQLSLSPKRQSVLNDDTNIEISTRPGWWNRLGRNSKDVTAIMNELDDEDITAKNLAEEMEIETLSQEKENYTLDLPESSENESICSIVMPPRKIFIHKDKPQMKFKNLEKNFITLADLKKSYFAEDKEIDVRSKKFFNQVQKPKTKPVFGAELLSTSFDKTITKSPPNIKGQGQNLFRKRSEMKQKNIYADFIATDSEDEIPEPQCKLFRFQMRTTQKRRSSRISELRPSTSNTTYVEMDSWKHLPSSTMVDSDFNDGGSISPLRKTRMSQLSKTSEIDIPLNQHNSSKKLRQPNLPKQAKDKSSSKIIGDEVHNSSIGQDQNQSFDKSTNSNSMRNLSRQKSSKELASANILQNSSIGRKLVQENFDQRTEEIVGINSNRMQNISLNNTLIKENVNQETEEMVKTHSKQMLNVSINKTLNQENVNQEIKEMVDINFKEVQKFSVDRTLINENVNQETDKSRRQENKSIEENHVIEIVARGNKDAETILQKEDLINQDNIESFKEHEIMEEKGNNRNNQSENENSIPKEGEIIQSNQERDDCDKENHTTIQNEKGQTKNDTNNEDNEEIQCISESKKNEIEADDEIQEQDCESDAENDVTGQEQLSENDEMSESGAELNETYEHEDRQMNSEQKSESHIDESSEHEEDMIECDQDDENINTEHENIPNNKSKTQSPHVAKSPEAVLHAKNNREESFAAPGRNSSNRKLKTILNTLNISPIADSDRYSEGFENSSAEGSGWDSHRILRKTFGKDFSPRKSLRNFVLQRSTKRQTNDVLANKSKRRTEVRDVPKNNTRQRETNSPEVSQFESYQEPEPVEVDESVEESIEDNERLKQMELENLLQRNKQKHAEEQRKVQEEVRNTLKSIREQPYNPFKMPELPKGIRRVTKNTIKQPSKPKPTRNELVTDDMLPPEFLMDMKYKPPKRFQGVNAPWITKRLYDYLEKKLEPKYDYKARVRAEKLVKTLYQFAKTVRPLKVAPQHAIDELKLEMARLNIVNTHYDFYNFFHDYMPREIRIRVNPDILNKIPVPRNVFGDIIRQEDSLHQ